MPKISKTFKAKVGSAWGTPLPKPVYFDYTADVYPGVEDMLAADDGFKPKEQLKLRNAQIKNTARQAQSDETLKALGYVKPSTANNPQLRLRDMYILLRQSNKGHDEAVNMAALNVDVAWDDEPEDGDIKWDK